MKGSCCHVAFALSAREVVLLPPFVDLTLVCTFPFTDSPTAAGPKSGGSDFEECEDEVTSASQISCTDIQNTKCNEHQVYVI